MPREPKYGVKGLHKDPDGRYVIDLRYTDLRTGKPDRFKERLPLGTTGGAAKRRAEEVLTMSLTGEMPKQGSETHPARLSKAFEKYHEWCAVNGGGDPMYKKRHTARWLAVLGDIQLVDLDEQAIERFKKARLDGAGDAMPPVAAGTVNRELVTMKHFLNRAVEWEWLPRRPKIRLLREPPPRVRSLSDAEWAKLEPALPKGLKRVALVAALSGQRLGNVIGMKKADVNFEHASISFPKTKSGKRHDVPISVALAVVLREAIAATKPESPWVFVSRHRKLGRPYTQSGISSLFKKVAERAGLVDLHFHDLRHDFATRIRRAGHGLDVVQALLGHASPAMTQRYAHLGREQLHTAVGAVALPHLSHQAPKAKRKTTAKQASKSPRKRAS